MNLYENIYIGAFIYTFGVLAGRHTNTASFNNYQQTPSDTLLGDLFGSWEGRNFLIEFKRDKKSIETELTKPSKLELIKYLHNAPNEKRNLSKKGHFMCYPEGNNFELIPYLKISEQNIVPLGFNNFVQSLLENSQEIGLSFKEFQCYLSVIQECAEDNESSVSGLVVNVSKDNKIMFIQYDNLIGLKKIIKQKLEQKLSQKKSIKL